MALNAKIPEYLKRNPNAPHVKADINWRLEKEKSKASVGRSRGARLSFDRYNALLKSYEEYAIRHKARHKANEHYKGVGVSFPGCTFPIAMEIARDFRRTKGIRSFGFGVGYGPLTFFLKNFMKMKTRGVEIAYFPEEVTAKKRLGIIHGFSVDDAYLKKLGKFKVTYSVGVFEGFTIDKKTALGMLDNLAAMTEKGGKSYHVILSDTGCAVSEEEIEARGFRIDKWELVNHFEKNSPPYDMFIKLTKIRD